jgi:hypothetical protein
MYNPTSSFVFPRECKKVLESIVNKQQRSNYKQIMIQGIMQGRELERRAPKDKKASNSDHE